MGSEIESTARQDVGPQAPRVFIYLRVATDRDADTASLDKQRAACQRYITERWPGLNLIAVSIAGSPLRIGDFESSIEGAA